MKKMISILMLFSLSLLMTSHAAVPTAVSKEANTGMILVSHDSITDPLLLQAQIEKENISVPVGYRLERINCYTYHMPDAVQSVDPQMQPSASGLLYATKNVFHGTRDFFYPDYPEASNYYEGPATVSETFSYSKSVIVSTSVPLGARTVKSTVGYDAEQFYQVEKLHHTIVPANKKIQNKVYIVYNQTTFDIYNKLTGKLVQQGAYTNKPIGLLIFEYTYSK